jgi:hypothetical protein
MEITNVYYSCISRAMDAGPMLGAVSLGRHREKARLEEGYLADSSAYTHPVKAARTSWRRLELLVGDAV